MYRCEILITFDLITWTMALFSSSVPGGHDHKKVSQHAQQLHPFHTFCFLTVTCQNIFWEKGPIVLLYTRTHRGWPWNGLICTKISFWLRKLERNVCWYWEGLQALIQARGADSITVMGRSVTYCESFYANS